MASLVALASMAVVLPAIADAYDAALARALVAKEKALDSNDPSDWAEALRLFEETDGIKSTRVSKYELAVAAARLHGDDVAFEAYEASIALGLDGPPREKAAAFITANRSSMAHVEVLGPAGAQVFVGSARRGTLPLARPMVVFAGTVHLRVVTTAGKSTDDEVITETDGHVTIDVRSKLGEPVPAPSSSASTAASGSGSVDSRALPPRLPPRTDRAPSFPLVVTGSGLVIVGVASVIVASTSLSSRRSSLAANCQQPSGTDSCTATYRDLHDAATNDVDAIATWKGVRTAGFVGAGVGAAVVVLGLIPMFGGGHGEGSGARWSPRVALTPGLLSLGLVGSF